VELWPGDGAIWNTLGVSYYRAGEWEEARSALYRSMELRNGGEGDAFDWFFLAMIHAKLGYTDRARSLYDKAAEWSRQSAPHTPAISPSQIAELSRFQVEAAQILGLPKPEPIPISTPDRTFRPSSPVAYPRNIRRARTHIIEPGLPQN
jgi:tetratricopeptide (TPR) repeat protein